ncbi:MAG: hypothetical protein HY347_03265 [candidate division NC10 bacterium]|nr:hypothetical protein [candidate division NC10 bacterium]
MPIPPGELWKLQDEERRREAAHRRIRWEARRRKLLWIIVGILSLAALSFMGRYIGMLWETLQSLSP